MGDDDGEDVGIAEGLAVGMLEGDADGAGVGDGVGATDIFKKVYVIVLFGKYSSRLLCRGNIKSTSFTLAV